MHNETILVQHSSDEQRENSAPNQSDTRETVKPTAMTPTPLEYSCWTRHPRAKFIVTAITFTGLSIVIGILIVFLTSPEAEDPVCSPMLNPTVRYSRPDSSHPMSIAVGDFNNDTYIDIVVANSGRDNVGVFLGYGNDSFASQVTYPTGLGSAPFMVIVVDFNHDNRLDIAVTNFGANNIGILLGREDGKFRNQTTIDTTPSRPRCLAFGDFNNDEQTDIVFTSYGTDKIYVLLGFGNGNFTIMVALSTGYDSLPHSVAVGDLNEDNQLDIVVANYGTDNVGVFLGCGNGTFTFQTTYTTGLTSRPYAIAIADLNKDMHVDIAVVNSRRNQLGILFGDENGTFFLPTFYSTGDNSNPISIVIADLNNDDKLDIVTANNGTDSAGVFLNHGNGTFADQMAYSTGLGSGPYSIAVADFNNDSQIDLAITNEQNNNVMIFNGYTNEVFAKQISYSTNIKNISPMGTFIGSTGDGSYPCSVSTGDLNNNGRQDVVVGNLGTNNVGIFLGNDNGTFASQTTYSTGDGSYPQSVSIGDFNNDGWRDIAVANSGTDNVGVLLGNGDGTFADQTTYSTGYQSKPISIIVDDFNNDGRTDIVVINAGTNNVGILLGNDNGTFASQTTYSTGDGSYPQSVSIGDFNNDGWLDIVVPYFGTNNVGVLLGNGDGTFANQTTYSTGDDSNPRAIIVGDFNSDSRVDIAVANSQTNSIGILLGNGDGTFGNQTIFSTGVDSYPSSITVGDFNNDSQVDIVVTNYRMNNVGILLGNGDGTFRNQRTYSTGYNSGPTAVTVADVNNDSRLDLIIGNSIANYIFVLLGYGDGTFPFLLCTSESISHPSSVAVGDFNNDSQLDIAVTDSAFNNVGIFLGYGDGIFASHTILPTDCNSNPNAIALGDFNNDSQLDIAVVNYGTNNVGILLGKRNGNFARQITYSTGNSSQPNSVAVGDLNNDGRLDIAVTNYGTSKLGIFLGYGDGTFAAQQDYSVGNGFFSTGIAIGDFNNDDRLDISLTNPVEFGIGIFFGYGDGTFQNQKIFFTGVYSYPLALAVGHFNNDSNLDIAVANAEPTEEVIFILSGNGNGNFSYSGRYKTSVSSLSSSLVVADFNNDNQLDIAVANSGTNNVGIFYGYGNGTFSSETTYPTGVGSNPRSVAIGDFNNDNHVDVVVANYGTSTTGIFLAFKNLSFVATTTLSTGSAAHPRAVAFGDFNNDGQMDVVVANSGTENIGILHRYEDGSFSMQIAYSANFPFYSESIVVNDFNNDNRLDIAVTNPLVDSIGVLFGEENGALGSYTAYSTGVGFNPRSIAVGDFNNDHRADIVVAYTGIGSIGVFLKADPGSFEVLKKRFSTGYLSKPEAIAVGDFDNDGRLDIAVANNGQASIGFFFASENGTFLNQSTIFLGQGIFPVWIGVADFNNDKQLDVVVVDNIDPAPVIVLLGNGNRSFQIEMTHGLAGAGSGAIADFDNDGRLDLALGQYFDSTLTTLFGYGDGTFGNVMIYSTGQNSAPASITVGDFNNDTRLDIAVTNQGTASVGIFLECGDGIFASQETYPTGDSNPLSLAVGDFNNDGQLDIAVANFGTNNVGILLGYGDGTFANQKTYSTGESSGPGWIAVGDFNNDGQLDIAVTHSESGDVGIFLGHVNGTFFSEVIYATGDQSQPVSIAVGDLNNDGRLDITFCDLWKENIGVLLGYADENFIRTEPYPIGSSSEPVSIAVGDFDNDTHLDVVTADRNNNELIIVHGSGYGTFSNQTSLSTGKDSHPSFVAVSDFNQDHRLDIAVVNSGTNTVGIFLGYGDGTFSNQTTYSTGDFSLPVSLAVGTFDNDTQLDIAVANSGISGVCLLRGYGNGSFMNPLCFPSGFGAYPSAVAFGDMNNDHLGDVAVCNDGFSTIEILSNVCRCTSKFKIDECERKIKNSK